MDDLPLLPKCDGPKLGSFSNRLSKIELIKQLSDPRTSSHSHVFDVDIGGARYALKVLVFKFYSLERDWGIAFWAETNKSQLPKDQGLPQTHYDPFFAECRAYGALNQHGLNGIISPKCYGYLMLTRSQELQIYRKFYLGDGDWDRFEPPEKGLPLRALVKELMRPGRSFERRQIPRMCRNLRTYHEIGVYINDIAVRNYRNGQIFDFSSAMTLPHMRFSYAIHDDEEQRDLESQDFIDFDRMVEDEGIKTTIRAAPDLDRLEKLRSHGHT